MPTSYINHDQTRDLLTKFCKLDFIRKVFILGKTGAHEIKNIETLYDGKNY